VTNSTALELTLEVQIDAEGMFTNRASVQAIEPDANLVNNLAEALTVLSLPESRRLAIEKAAGPNRVVVSWPVSPVPFVLQSTSALRESNAWDDVDSPPVVSGGRNRVTNDVTQSASFYRLTP
jgi:hypothetical protein